MTERARRDGSGEGGVMDALIGALMVSSLLVTVRLTIGFVVDTKHFRLSMLALERNETEWFDRHSMIASTHSNLYDFVTMDDLWRYLAAARAWRER